MKAIFTHDNTDFDALAAMLAASKLHPQSVAVLPPRPNRNLRDFLTLYGAELPFVDAEDLPQRRIEQVILVDTQLLTQTPLTDNQTRVEIIDHHPLDITLSDGVSFSGEQLGATTTLLVEEIQDSRVSISVIEATLLLMGIYEDTGSLSYSATTPRDVRAAAWLLENGASLTIADQFLRQPLTPEQREQYRQLVDESEFHRVHGHDVLIATMVPDQYVEELSTLAHKLNDLYDPDASFLLAQFDDSLQLVARSRTDAIDVGEIARVFGGGGHSKAAAARVQDIRIDEATRWLLGLLEERVRPLVTVREIMSRAVHTLPPETSISDAEVMMRRYGHEGYPVVSDRGKLLGILTRQEIDRALHHGLGESEVRAYMHKGGVAVSPEDSVTEVSRVMIEHGLGQVPVEENGEVIGIVTRTDLIKLWSTKSRPSRVTEIAARMDEALPAPLRDILLLARNVANEMGYSLYVVGGFVRDVLLGIPTMDLDLVVEGDAIALARRLSTITRGRVRSHSRFGTAKVILGGTAGTSLPASLDFVTARREFYEHPTALPRIEHSSIKQDLYRRDFTINTMAISLDRDRYGTLLDFYGGESDLEARRIRVLHNLSFVEDPTRMLRAVRLEQRLRFEIEERTSELINDALELLDRVTPERLRHEIYSILEEHEPETSFLRLHDLGILSRVHPALRFDERIAHKFLELRQSVQRRAGLQRVVDFASVELLPPGAEAPLERHQGGPAPADYLAVMAFAARPEDVRAWTDRLRIVGADARQLAEVNDLAQNLLHLDREGLAPSAVYELLHGRQMQSLFVFRVATDSPVVRGYLDLYTRKLRRIKPRIDGTVLKRMGVPIGPHYRVILSRLRNARLDGLVSTAKEETELVRGIVESMGLLAD